MSVEFRVLDGNEGYYEDFDCFVDLYKSDVSVNRIKDSLGLSPAKYKHYLERAVDDGLVALRVSSFNNYYYSKGVYCVQKYLNGRMVYFGSYKSEDDARFVVSELKKCGWDKDCLDSIRSML